MLDSQELQLAFELQSLFLIIEDTFKLLDIIETT